MNSSCWRRSGFPGRLKDCAPGHTLLSTKHFADGERALNSICSPGEVVRIDGQESKQEEHNSEAMHIFATSPIGLPTPVSSISFLRVLSNLARCTSVQPLQLQPGHPNHHSQPTYFFMPLLRVSNRHVLLACVHHTSWTFAPPPWNTLRKHK